MHGIECLCRGMDTPGGMGMFVANATKRMTGQGVPKYAYNGGMINTDHLHERDIMNTKYIVQWITPDGDETWTDEDEQGNRFQGITDARRFAENLLDYNEATEVEVCKEVTTIVVTVLETITAGEVTLDKVPAISDPMKDFFGFLTGK